VSISTEAGPLVMETEEMQQRIAHAGKGRGDPQLYRASRSLTARQETSGEFNLLDAAQYGV